MGTGKTDEQCLKTIKIVDHLQYEINSVFIEFSTNVYLVETSSTFCFTQSIKC